MPRKLSRYLRGLTTEVGIRTSRNFVIAEEEKIADINDHKLQVDSGGVFTGSVGVGTTIPGQELEVFSDGNFAGIRIKSTRTGLTEQIGGVGFSTSSDQVATINALVDGTVLVKNTTSDTERLRIDPTGRLLVGLTTAMTTGSNDIRDTIQGVAPAGAQLLLGRNDTTTAATNRLGEIAALGNDNNGIYQIGATIRFEAYNPHATDNKPTSIVFKTCGESSATLTERMRVGAGGTVYIGPNGRDFASGSAQRGQLHIEREVTYDDDTPNYRNKNLLTLENATDQQECVQTFIGNWSGNNRYANIVWRPGSSQGASSLIINSEINDANHLVIRGSGLVGINSETPESLLDIVGQNSEDKVLSLFSYDKKSAIKFWPSDVHDLDRWRMALFENNAVSDNDNYPDWMVDGYGRQFMNNNLYIGRSRSFADAPSTRYRYYGTTGPGLFIYNGTDGDETNYSAYLTMRCYHTDDDDRKIIYYVHNNDVTAAVDYDLDQTFGVTGSGRVQGKHVIYSGRVESDEADPNSVYADSTNNGFFSYYGSGYSAYMRSRNTDNTEVCFYLDTGGGPVFKVVSNGNGYFDGVADAGNADYAEYFEWSDGNPNNEDRRGYPVIVVPNTNGKIGIATTGDDRSQIMGIVSANPGFVGDSASLNWQGRHLRDEWGSWVTEDQEFLVWNKRGTHINENGEKVENPQPDVNDPNCDPEHSVLVSEIATTPDIPQYALDNNLRITKPSRVTNPDFDPSQTYTPRSDRQEWSAVGLMGKLWLRANQPTGDRWIKLKDGNNGLSYWLVR